MGKAARRKHDDTPAAAVRAAAPRRAPVASAGMPGWLRLVIGPACIVALGWLVLRQQLHHSVPLRRLLRDRSKPDGAAAGAARQLPHALARPDRADLRAQRPPGRHRRVGLPLRQRRRPPRQRAAGLRCWSCGPCACRASPAATGATARALATLVALVFVAHPLQTMAASYLVQRAESLASFFYLVDAAALRARVALDAPAARAAPAWSPRRCSRPCSASLSKETVATVPVAVLLYWFCFLPRRARRIAAALAGAAGAARCCRSPTAVAGAPLPDARAGADDRSPGRAPGCTSPPPASSVEGVAPVALPAHPVRRRPLVPAPLPAADGAGASTTAGRLSTRRGAPTCCCRSRSCWRSPAAAVLAFRRYRLATFCLGWVFITLAPTSSIIPLRDAAFEHRMYLPIVGLAWLTDRRRLRPARLRWRARSRQAAAPAVARRRRRRPGCGSRLLGAATMQRNAVFARPLPPRRRQRAPRRRATGARSTTTARRCCSAARLDEAVARLRGSACASTPSRARPRIAARQPLPAAAARSTTPSACSSRRRSMPEESVVAAALQNLAYVYQTRGDHDRAEAALLRVTQLKPQWTSVQRQLAGIYSRKENWIAAANYLQRRDQGRSAPAQPGRGAGGGRQLQGGHPLRRPAPVRRRDEPVRPGARLRFERCGAPAATSPTSPPLPATGRAPRPRSSASNASTRATRGRRPPSAGCRRACPFSHLRRRKIRPGVDL